MDQEVEQTHMFGHRRWKQTGMEHTPGFQTDVDHPFLLSDLVALITLT